MIFFSFLGSLLRGFYSYGEDSNDRFLSTIRLFLDAAKQLSDILNGLRFVIDFCSGSVSTEDLLLLLFILLVRGSLVSGLLWSGKKFSRFFRIKITFLTFA